MEKEPGRRGIGFLRDILSSRSGDKPVDNRNTENTLEGNMIRVMEENGRKGDVFGYEQSESNGRPAIIFRKTRLSGRVVEEVSMIMLRSGVKVGESGGFLDSVEVKESDCKHYSWFRRALEKVKNNISVNIIKEERKPRFRRGGGQQLSSTA